ncbi:hypothetical protein VTK73DRAFT_6433 [Phialemonium thermophilum]|uniref:Pkr1-domain-containing protein n=1 Tax=Phialemonium thermophilum TaxID=223376 RepID=A0ABR3WJF3_9PEZI
MASFIQDLWESIFTPGPTPTLLVATNATFAALQVVLALLIFMTWSVHFIVLSVLSGALWWAINWFARELKVHQEQEEEKARLAQEVSAPRRPGPPTTEESETEVETGISSGVGAKRRAVGAAEAVPSAKKNIETVEVTGELKHRGGESAAASASQGTKSSASTEDEWEKVSENEKEKDK